jgi:Cdc6-like AAA superfamily ATPase
MEINEVKNNKYELSIIKMKNDGIIKGIQDPLPSNYGFFMLLIGKPGTGKTNLWISLLKKSKKKNSFYKRFDKVYIFSNSLHTITAQIQLPPERLYNGIDELEDVIHDIKETDDKCLIILDDVITDIKKQPYIQSLIFNRRHIGGSVSIILISQIFNKIDAPLRKCASDLVVFSTGNKKEIKNIYDDFMNIEYADYIKIINYCFTGAHDFLYYKCANSSYFKNFNKLDLEFN